MEVTTGTVFKIQSIVSSIPKMHPSLVPRVIHSAPGSTLPTTTGGLKETCKQTGHPTAWPATPSHWVCTWMSSSSSLCLRALYRNIPRLLHASPGQTTVTTASPWALDHQQQNHYTSLGVPSLRRNFHTGLKVYADAVTTQIRPELKAERSVRGCSLQNSIHC